MVVTRNSGEFVMEEAMLLRAISPGIDRPLAATGLAPHAKKLYEEQHEFYDQEQAG